MSNIDKLKATMRKYGVLCLYYTPGTDLNADIYNGVLFFIGALNESFISEIYAIYTEDGCPGENQNIDVWMAPEGSNDFKVYTETAMEVLYA